MTVASDTLFLQPAGQAETSDPRHALRLEIAVEVARVSLDRRRGVVRSALLAALSEDRRAALRGLAAWYERMCVDPHYCNNAPEEGTNLLMALAQEDHEPAHRRFKITYWAVRVAEQLANCRARLAAKGSTPEELDVELAKLDLAFRAMTQSLDPTSL